MDTILDRRSFVLGGAAALLSRPGYAQTGLEPWTWAWVGASLAAGAIGFISGLALEKAMGKVTTDQLMRAIEDLRRDLPALVLAQARLAVLEGEVRQIQGQCRAVDLNLREYSSTKDPTRLDAAHAANALAIGHSEALREAGLPTFAIAISQRAILLQVMAKQQRSTALLRSLRTDLSAHSHYANQMADDYIGSLSPTKRISSVVCYPPRPPDSFRLSRTCGGGFCVKPPFMTCTAKVDQSFVTFSEGDYYNGDDWDTVKGLAGNRAAAEAGNFQAFQDKARLTLQKPLATVTKQWKYLASKLS